MKVSLLITTFNRPSLLKECMRSVHMALTYLSLHELHTPEVATYIIDDCSTDQETLSLIKDYPMLWNRKVITKDKNKGIKDSLLIGFDEAFTENEVDVSFDHSYKWCNSDYAINLDPDSIVKENFFTEILRLKQLYPDHIVSGFNCNHPANPVLIDNGDHVMRRHCNGISMCISKEQYENIVRPSLLKPGNWDWNATNKLPFVISQPSLIEHTGWNQSSMNHGANGTGDRACDF